MATPTYSYNGQLWKPCPTTSDKNSFFNSAFGKRDNEGEAFFDKQAKFRHEYWGTFLTYFENTTMPSSLKDALKKSWSTIDKYKNASIEDPSSFKDYVSDVKNAEHKVVMEEIPILAALENIEIVVMSRNEPNAIVIQPNVDILGDYPYNSKSKETVILCVEGNTFSRLEPISSNDSSQTIQESDVEFSNYLLKYKKGNSAGSKGVEYQVSIVMVFLLNAFQKLRNWKLSTENEVAGKFDDVVLEWHEGAIVLQAKHKQNKSRKITLEDLISTNTKNDFSLPKYFLAYEGIKNKFKIKNLIICTNASVDEKILDYVKRHKVNGESILYYGNEKCTFYTFNDNLLSCLIDNILIYYEENYQCKGIDKAVISEKNLKQFFNLLQLHSSYPLKGDMMEVVEIILSRMKQLKMLQGQISSTELYTKVMNWFQQKKGFYLTETYAKAIFSEICKDIHCRQLQKYDVFFETDFDFHDSNRFHHIAIKYGCFLQEMKLFQTLQKMKKNFLYVNLDNGIRELQQAMEAFKLPFYKTLILVWSETCEKSIVTQVCNITHILDEYKGQDKNEKKEIILIAQSIETLPLEIKRNCSVVEGTVTFRDLSKKTQTDILTRNVIFQGNNFSLKDLCGMQEIQRYVKALNTDMLERLIKREEVKVGVQLPCLRNDIRQFYINRTFQRTITQENYNECFRSISEERFSEESLCNINEKVIVISDIAGMGKSTVFTVLAAIIKKQHPELWVIRINLNEYTEILRHYVDNNIQRIAIEDLLNSVTDTMFKNGLENELFSMQDKVVLMLDGIDEISPYYTTLLMDMLIQCQQEQNFWKIFLSTRPYLIKELESKLNVKSFKLQPFMRENQIDFFAMFWTHNLSLNEKEAQKCKQYATGLRAKLPGETRYSDNFGATPQHLQMLAEIFQEKNRMGTFGTWQGCKEFVRTDESEPKLPNQIDLVTLYAMFIERKRQLFLKRENPPGHPGADQALTDQFEECLVVHRYLALEIIVGENCHLFSSYKSIPTDNMKIMETICKIGIVQKIRDNWHFVHKTFAEYFVAQSIIEELKCRNQNLKFQRFLIERILIDNDYQHSVIRAFLNNSLNSMLDELPSDIFNCYKHVRSKISLKEWTKFYVIRQLAVEGFVAILRLFLKCIKVETVGNKLVDGTNIFKIFSIKENGYISSNVLKILETLVRKGGVNIKDDDIRTPLFYAVWNNRLEMVKFLVEEKNAKIKVKDGNGFSIPFWAILYDYQDIVQILFNKMKKGLNPNDGITMYTAAYLGELDILKELVSRGANLNCRVERRETLLFAAVRGRQLEIVKYLVSQGVDVDSINVWNAIENPPWRIKTFRNYTEQVNISGHTALHLAVYHGLLNLVEVLLDFGAKLDIKDCEGQTPRDLAADRGHLDIVNLLKDCEVALCYKNNTNYFKGVESSH